MLSPTPRRKERSPRLAKFSLLKGATAAGSHICPEGPRNRSDAGRSGDVTIQGASPSNQGGQESR
jgi:hypothetical protein